MKVLLFALLVLVVMLGGCKDNVKVSCPDCTIKSIDGNNSFECNQCTVEAEVSEDFKIPQRPERD